MRSLLVAALALLILCTLSAGFPPDDYTDLKEALQDWNQIFKDTFKEGDDLFAQGNYDDAIVKYDRCLEIAPGNANALNNKALAMLKKGNHEGALQLLDRIIANADTYLAYNRDNILRRARLNNAAVLIDKNEFAEAVENLVQLSADYPGDKKIEANLAEARAGLPTPTPTPKPTPTPTSASSPITSPTHALPDLPSAEKEDSAGLKQGAYIGLGIVFLVAFLVLRSRSGKTEQVEGEATTTTRDAPLETPAPAPSAISAPLAPSKPEATLPKVSAPITPVKDEAAPTGVVVKRGYDVEGEFLRFFVKVENHLPEMVADVKVLLEYPEDKVDLERPKNAIQRIGTLDPGEKKSVKYHLRPRACIETSIEGKVFYKDVHGEKVELDVRRKDVLNVCPLLKEVSITREEFQALWYSSGLADTKETKSYAVGLRASMDVVKTSLSNMTLVGEEGTESFWHAAFAATQKNSGKHVLADIQVAGSGSESSVTIEVKSEDPDARAGFIMNVVESISLQIRKMEVL